MAAGRPPPSQPPLLHAHTRASLLGRAARARRPPRARTRAARGLLIGLAAMFRAGRRRRADGPHERGDEPHVLRRRDARGQLRMEDGVHARRLEVDARREPAAAADRARRHGDRVEPEACRGRPPSR
eukprot:940744-Prymnesium_polylepis.1